MQSIIDNSQYVIPEVNQGLNYPEDRTFNEEVDLDTSLLADGDASDELFQKYMSDLNVDESMERARLENAEGNRREVIVPDDFDIDESQRVLSEFEQLDDLEAEDVISNDTINNAVKDKIKLIELSNYKNQLRVDEITKTAMETNNILNYILWLLDTLNIDIEAIGDLIEEYKNLIVILRRKKRVRESENTDVGTDTDDLPLREQQELDDYIDKYELLLSKYRELVKIISEHKVNDLDLDLLQDILTRNKYSSKLMLDKLSNSIDKIKDYSSESLPTSTGSSDENLDGQYNEKLFTSIYFIRKLADQLNITDDELSRKYPIILLQGDAEINLQNERRNVLATIEGLKLTSEILSDPENPEYANLTTPENLGGNTPQQLIDLINEIIRELNDIINDTNDSSSEGAITGGSLNMKMGILQGGATYKESLQKMGKELVVNNMLSPKKDDGDTLEKKIKSFSMTTPKNNDFIKIKMRYETLSKLIEISFKDFSFLLSQDYNDYNKTINALENINVPTVKDKESFDKMLSDVWNSRSPTVDKFVEMSKELSTYEFDTNNKFDEFLSKIKSSTPSEDDLANIYMPFILDLFKEKRDLKVLSKKATPETVKYAIFIMKLSGAVRHFLLNKTDSKKKSIEAVEQIISQPEIDEFADRDTLNMEVARARKAVQELVGQVNKDSAIRTSVFDKITGRPVIPPGTLGAPGILRDNLTTPRPGPPNNTPRKRIFGDTELDTRIPKIKDTNIKKVLKKLEQELPISPEQVGKILKNELDESNQESFDIKREEILNDSKKSPQQQYRAIADDVLIPAFQMVKPAPDKIEEIIGIKNINFAEVTGKIKTAISNDIETGDDTLGFALNSDDVSAFSRILLPSRFGKSAVAPIEYDMGLDDIDTPRTPTTPSASLKSKPTEELVDGSPEDMARIGPMERSSPKSPSPKSLDNPEPQQKGFLGRARNALFKRTTGYDTIKKGGTPKKKHKTIKQKSKK